MSQKTACVTQQISFLKASVQALQANILKTQLALVTKMFHFFTDHGRRKIHRTWVRIRTWAWNDVSRGAPDVQSPPTASAPASWHPAPAAHAPPYAPPGTAAPANDAGGALQRHRFATWPTPARVYPGIQEG